MSSGQPQADLRFFLTIARTNAGQSSFRCKSRQEAKSVINKQCTRFYLFYCSICNETAYSAQED